LKKDRQRSVFLSLADSMLQRLRFNALHELNPIEIRRYYVYKYVT